MADYNPYQAPSAHVADVASSEDIELAGRGLRLGAALIDGVLAIFIALIVWYLVAPGMYTGVKPTFLQSLSVGLITLAIWIAINFTLLARNGQTFGKKMLNIKIVRSDATPSTVARIAGLRFLVPGLLTQIPVAGMVFWLVDSLFIFQESRRTLHDLIADTIVIRA